jgi:pimeloyl-ACP methyl ester carboxylesterase
VSVANLGSGVPIEYLEMGTGTPVVYLEGAGAPPEAALMSALALRFRVVAPSLPASGARQEAELLRRFIREVIGGPVHVIAESEAGAVGCWLAITEPELVQSLVLVAPESDADLRARLPEIAAPTLIVWGTADEVAAPESGQVYLQRIPNSYRILMYGATHSVPTSACRRFVALTTDFIERGDRFVVAEPTTP